MNDEKKEKKEQNLVCLHCGEKFRCAYEEGRTQCLGCGLVSGVRVEGQETSNVTSVEKEKKGKDGRWYGCSLCGIQWISDAGKNCILCGQKGKKVE